MPEDTEKVDKEMRRAKLMQAATKKNWEIVYDGRPGIQLRRKRRISTSNFLIGILLLPVYGVGLGVWLIALVANLQKGDKLLFVTDGQLDDLLGTPPPVYKKLD